MGLNQDTLVSVNWRTKKVAEMTLDGEEIGWFTHDEMVEPIGVSVTAQVCSVFLHLLLLLHRLHLTGTVCSAGQWGRSHGL